MNDDNTEFEIADDGVWFATGTRGVIVLCLALLLLGFCAGKAYGQEVEHPAFGARHVTQLSVTSDVPDIAKLEGRAIDILRKPGTVTGEVMTLEEARAVVRIDGKTDVARCPEVIYAYQLRIVTQAVIDVARISNEHPEAAK